VVSRDELTRPLDIRESIGDPSKASKLLDWKAKVDFKEIISRMITAQRTSPKHSD
jgi:GDP-D-mannose dehydratase